MKLIAVILVIALVLLLVDALGRGKGGRGGKGKKGGRSYKYGRGEKDWKGHGHNHRCKRHGSRDDHCSDDHLKKRLEERYAKCLRSDKSMNEPCKAFKKGLEANDACLAAIDKSKKDDCKRFIAYREKYDDMIDQQKQITSKKTVCEKEDANVKTSCADPTSEACSKAIEASKIPACQQMNEMQSCELEIRNDIDEML